MSIESEVSTTPSYENPYADKATKALEEDLSIALEQYADSIADLSEQERSDLSSLVNELRERSDLSASGAEQVERVAKELNPQEIFNDDEEEMDLPAEDEEE